MTITKILLFSFLFLALGTSIVISQSTAQQVAQPDMRANTMTVDRTIRINGVGTTAPIDHIYLNIPVAGVNNNLYGWKFNADWTAADQPVWSEDFESRFVPGAAPGGLLERHGNYVSIDRTVNYRPWNFNIDLNDHGAQVDLALKLLQVHGRTKDYNLMTLWPDNDQIMFRMPNSANPFTVIGGPGNIHFLLNPDQGFFLSSTLPATPQNPKRNSVALFLSGYSWNGQTSVAANTVLQTVVDSPENYHSKLQVGAQEYHFGSDGRMTAPQFVAGYGGPSWTSGEGEPTQVAPPGSLYSRTDGGGRLYVRQDGKWVAK